MVDFPRSVSYDDEETVYSPPRTPTHRVRLSPSLPNIHQASFEALWARDACNAEDIQNRPHLGSLDLASPTLKHAASATHIHQLQADPTPLTPPLTPATSLASDSSGAESAQQPPASAYRMQGLGGPTNGYGSACLKSSPIDAPSFPSSHSLSLHASSDPDSAMWSHRPALPRTHSISSSGPPTPREHVSSSPTRMRPQLLLGQTDSEPDTGRFLLVSGVPKNISSHTLREQLNCEGDIRGININLQAEHGAILVAFYDARHAAQALRKMCSQLFFDDMRRLTARFVTLTELRAFFPRGDRFVADGDARLVVTCETALEPEKLQNVLTGFGDLQSFQVSPEPGRLEVTVEYFDCRAAMAARGALDGRSMLGTHIRVSTPAHPFDPPTTPLRTVSSDQTLRSRAGTERELRRRASEINAAEQAGAAWDAHMALRMHNMQVNVVQPVAPVPYVYTPPVTTPQLRRVPPRMLPIVPYPLQVDIPRAPGNYDYYGSPTSTIPTPTTAAPPNQETIERNRVDIDKVERGEDTRTTIMIKNIPNKMSDRNLLDFIYEVCPHRIDFMYLRMDFMNGCNVGYAFVNFITVHDLLAFAKARLGVKWNMFASEKVLQMTYANYQGKEALVEKFKNSCIMDEREEWRPKIFYSSGPRTGWPEPFPAPTHTKRKERSQANQRERVLYVHQPRGRRPAVAAAF